MRYALLLSVLGIAQVLLGLRLGIFGWLLFWSGVNFVIVGAAYGGLGPRVLGKRADGTLAWPNIVLLLPYFLLTWMLWYGQQRITREPSANEVIPGVWLGRRPLSERELPPSVGVIADLAAEFWEPRAIRIGQRTYLNLPTLDAATPTVPEFTALVTTLAAATTPIYIHCALGHGRSALIAAAILLRRKLADDARQAEAMVNHARPGVELNRAQREFLSNVMTISSASQPAGKAMDGKGE